MFYYWLWLVGNVLVWLLCYDALEYVVDRNSVTYSQFLIPVVLTLLMTSIFLAVYGLDFMGWLCHRIPRRAQQGGQEALAVGMPQTIPVVQKTAVAWSGEGQYEYQFNLGGIYAEAMSRGKPVTAQFIDGTFDVLEDKKVSKKVSSNHIGERRYRRQKLSGAADADRVDQYRQEPVGKASIESDVMTPFAKAGITGIACALVGLYVGYRAHGDLLDFSAIPFFIGFIGMWLYELDFGRLLRYKWEEIRQHDDDGDGAIGKPKAGTHPVLLNAEQVRQKLANEAAERAQEVDQGAALAMIESMYSLGGNTKNPHKSNTKAWSAFNARRDKLVQLGILRWKSAKHTSGTELTTDLENAKAKIATHWQDNLDEHPDTDA